MTAIVIHITRLPHGEDLKLPISQSRGAAGLDLVCADYEDIIIEPGQRALVPTGISIAVPDGWEAQVRARSGLAFNNGVGLANGIGTIDSDYRGEIKVILINHGRENFLIKRGDRIAQLIISRVGKVEWEEVKTLSETPRGEGGIGSTGT